MVRTFIALELSDEIRRRIKESQEILLRCGARLTPVDPKSAHITLKFLGETDPTLIEPIIRALQSVRHAPFEIAVSGISGNNPSRPRVIWGVVRDGGECARLNGKVEDLLEPLGIPREERRFTPHVTLARVRQFDPSLLPQIRSLASVELGRTVITGMKLKKSTLTPGGPIYTDLAEVPL
jgi:RNA 2',3'-cyclic 3'-phosphodiesterase